MPEIIILLTIDALRKDHFTPDYFPKFHQLSDEFTFFDNAYSHGVATPFSFPGIIAGELVHRTGSITSSTETLAELLSSYSSVGFGNNPHLISSRGYGRGFNEFHHAAPPDDKGTTVVIDSIKRFLRSTPISSQLYQIKESVKKIASANNLPSPAYVDAEGVKSFVLRQISNSSNKLVWGHFMDPHHPFDPGAVPTGLSLPKPSKDINKINEQFINNDGSADLSTAKRLYQINLQYLDEHLYDFLHRLKKLGVYENSLIVMTSDHGELFGEHNQTAHPWDIIPYKELIEIPLVVKYPNSRFAGNRYDHIVSHSDIIPTILDEVFDADHTEQSAPLQDDIQRYPISLSNAAKRITGPNGTIIQRYERENTHGSVTTNMKEQLNEVDLPKIPHLSGEVAGLNQVNEQEIEDRLESLGYK